MTSRRACRRTAAIIRRPITPGRVTGRLIERIEPLLGVAPVQEFPTQPFPLIARLGYGFDADKVAKE